MSALFSCSYLKWSRIVLNGTPVSSAAFRRDDPFLKSLQLLTFFDFFLFSFKSFVKVELSYVFTINLFTISEICTER